MKGLGFYAIIIVLLIITVTVLMQQGGSTAVTYAQVVDAFENEQVTEFVIDGSTLRASLKDDTTLEYSLPSVDLFFNDLGDTIKEQKAAGIIKDYNWIVRQVPWWASIIPYIVLIVIFGLFYYFMFSKQDGGGRGAMQFGKARIKHASDDKRHVTFQDVAGADEEKAELEEIVEFLKNPQKFTQIGARIPKGVLLVGPPGTGKTLLARAVAGEAGVPFLSISGSDFVELYVGVGASRVRDLFNEAKKNAPAIVFIDEIDAVGRHRGAGLGGGHDEREQTLNQLLVEMDGFGANEGVIVIAATNRQDILDPALLRPGRFDRQVYVGAPDMKGREAILHVHARGKQFDPDVRFDSIAKSTAGFTGADLENLLNEAALLAARRNKRLISMEDIEDSFLKVIMGTEKKSRVMSDHEKKLTAYHEAGHAIATRCLPTQDPVHTVSIVPRGRAGGFTMSLPQEEKFYASKKEMLDDLIVLLGGRVAEKLTMDDISTGASNDIERATSVAKSMVTKYGMSDVIGPINYSSGQQEIFIGRDMVERSDSISEELASKIDGEIRKVVLDAYEKCENILKEHIEQLRAVAEYLVRNETMDGDAFEKLFNGEEVPDHTSGEQLFHLESGFAKTAAQDSEKTKTVAPEEKKDDFQPMDDDADQTRKISADGDIDQTRKIPADDDMDGTQKISMDKTQRISLDEAVTRLFVQEDQMDEDNDPTHQDDGE
ncbi:MAG: ATP-dependent zinc metalloprotease FtsH [Clostridia bacterium]|nr:ATP-dependent zinc metalloprotease FtsH [Clostridia bacterium]